MIHAKLGHCENLAQFYKELRAAQEEAHGKDYCAHHSDIYGAITDLRFDDRTKKVAYKELGVNQGATAAIAAIAAAHHLHLVDVDLSNIRPHLHLFHHYYERVNPHALVDVYEMSSLTPELGAMLCDVLFIDTIHHPDHVVKELNLHAPTCSSTIIIHDTGTFPEIHEAATKALPRALWGVVAHNTKGAGHTIFTRHHS